MNSTFLLEVNNLRKTYTKGIFRKRIVFQLEADFAIQEPTIVGMLGPNGAGKTTLLELIAGQINPSNGKVVCLGQNIHKVKHNQRKYLVAHHCPPSQFFRSNQKYLTKALPINLTRRCKRFLRDFVLESSRNSGRTIYLYDELDFDDGYCGILLDYFSESRRRGHLVFFCFHPTKPLHLEIMRRICGHFIFVYDGALTHARDFETLLEDERVRDYLGFENDADRNAMVCKCS
jgi:ABC-type dipeptide/oligopeptide/nickel transport system ATPase component